jgi:MFS family permease
VAKANNLAVHQPPADKFPIGIRSMSAAITSSQVLGNLSPVVVGAIATWAGGVEGWRWAFVLGIPGAPWPAVSLAAPAVREADVLGEMSGREPGPALHGSRLAR